MAGKITFVHAPDIRYDQNYGTLFTPLWAYTLAAYVPDDWDQEIYDCVLDDPSGIGPSDVFAFSGINQDFDNVMAVRAALKSRYPDARFIVGGPMTWSFEQEGNLHLFDIFDYIFIMDGEETLPAFLRDLAASPETPPDKIIRASRFSLDRSKPVRFDLFRARAESYYGAVIEVSRGCPFLCEFCDIRVLPGNNRANNRAIELIVDEIDNYHRLGINQLQFACDNFIGDPKWARECVDAILEWKTRTGADISIFTWLTINLYKFPDLMENMRRAGFSILFIGIESVNHNSLLETAKVQNCDTLRPAVEAIQSHGFIIAPGFIFGFDSDTETVFDDTLDFIRDAGVIGGDPSFLMALPGTPLFQRMKRTGRLVERVEEPTVRMKITTNVRYLQDADFLARGFIGFLRTYCSAEYQLARFRNHLRHIADSDVFIPIDGVGYGSRWEYFKLQLRDISNLRMFFLRIAYILHKPSNFIAAVKAWWLLRRHADRHPGLGIHFNYWIYVWTNIGLKYWGLKRQDFELHNVDADFDIQRLVDDGGPAAVDEDREYRIAGEEKVSHQQRFTNRALKDLVARLGDEKPAPKLDA